MLNSELAQLVKKRESKLRALLKRCTILRALATPVAQFSRRGVPRTGVQRSQFFQESDTRADFDVFLQDRPRAEWEWEVDRKPKLGVLKQMRVREFSQAAHGLIRNVGSPISRGRGWRGSRNLIVACPKQQRSVAIPCRLVGEVLVLQFIIPLK